VKVASEIANAGGLRHFFIDLIDGTSRTPRRPIARMIFIIFVILVFGLQTGTKGDGVIVEMFGSWRIYPSLNTGGI